MQGNNRFKVGWVITLIAAFCFAVVSGFHVARSITATPAPYLSVLGFSAEDICGTNEDGSTDHCPNCLLANDALLADLPCEITWTSYSLGLDFPCPDPQCKRDLSTRVYQPRGPPLFT